MFIKTKHGYLNAQHIVRLCVGTVLKVGCAATWEIYAETTNGKRYPLRECILTGEDAERELNYIASCINLGIWEK